MGRTRRQIPSMRAKTPSCPPLARRCIVAAMGPPCVRDVLRAAALLVCMLPATRASPAADAVRPSGPVTREERGFWSFQPLSRPAAPDVKDAAWPRSEIDRFVLARLESAGLRPAPAASKRVLLRRATFDLIGLPPEPAEIEDFLADDSPGAFARVVDRLLASPHHGERFGRLWLDVVRYADTAGETADYPVPEAHR